MFFPVGDDVEHLIADVELVITDFVKSVFFGPSLYLVNDFPIGGAISFEDPAEEKRETKAEQHEQCIFIRVHSYSFVRECRSQRVEEFKEHWYPHFTHFLHYTPKLLESQ